MSPNEQPSEWCALSINWIARHGVSEVDATQRRGLANHARSCPACLQIVREAEIAAAAEGTPGGDRVEGPHAADETLRRLVDGKLEEPDRTLFEQQIRPHLAACEFCADRLAMFEGNTDAGDDQEVVVGRASPLQIPWVSGRAELRWLLEQPYFGISSWLVELELSNGQLTANLAVEGDEIQTPWRFTVLLGNDTEIVPKIAFSGTGGQQRVQCLAKPDETWVAIPILTAELPSWSRLLAVERDVATLVAEVDAVSKPLVLHIPEAGANSRMALEPWLDALLVDIHGERLACSTSSRLPDGPASGRIVARSGGEIGSWKIDLRPGGGIAFHATPLEHSVVRFASPIVEDSPLIWLDWKEEQHRSANHRESFGDDLADLARFRMDMLGPDERTEIERMVRESTRAQAWLESEWMGDVLRTFDEPAEFPGDLSEMMFMMVQPGPVVMAELYAETEGSEVERAFRVEQSHQGVTVVAEQEGDHLRVSATVDRALWLEPEVIVGLLGGGGSLLEARLELRPMQHLPEGIEKSRGASYLKLPDWWGKPESGDVEVYVLRTPEAMRSPREQ